MKRLVIVRHAKAEEHRMGLSDFNRSLTDRGVRNASFIASTLVKKGISKGQLISSPANRALETAQIFAQEFGIDESSIIQKKSLYNFYEISEIKQLIEEEDIDSDCVFVFGHNPTLAELAYDLSGSFNDHLPTSGVIVIDFDVRSWGEIKNRQGRIALFEHPKK